MVQIPIKSSLSYKNKSYMKGTIVVLFALMAVGFTLTDREICQQGLNGIFEQNKLADPKTLLNCASDDSTHKIVAFIGKALDKAAKGSVSDLISLISDVKDFVNSLPPSELDCASTNAEALSLLPLYHIDPNNPDATEKKIIAYVTLHYFTVHKWLVDCDDTWNAGKYYDTGFKGAGYLHQILGASLPEITDREICQQGLNGIFEQNKLADPKTLLNCASDDSTHKIVAFIGKALDKAAKGSISDLISLISDVKNFVNSLPPSELDCTSNNPEALSLLPLYHIDPNNPDATEKKIITYVTLHYPAVHKWLVDCDDTWNAGKYYDTGFKGAGYLHQVLGATLPQVTDKQAIQQMLNGIFEQNKLKDPTTIVPCIDDDSAHKIVIFVGQVLDKAAKGSVSDIIGLKDLINNFTSSLNPAVGECLDGNAEVTELTDAYNLTNADGSEIEKRVITYITLHYFAVHKWLGEVDTDYHNGKYYTVGYKAGDEVHLVLGNKISRMAGKVIAKAYQLRKAVEDVIEAFAN